MPHIRFDDFTSLYQGPGDTQFSQKLRCGIFRPFKDFALACQYADEVSAWLVDHLCPQPVFVVRGPTSTTKSPFEVVDATAGYSVQYRVDPPGGAQRASTIQEVTQALRQRRLHQLVADAAPTVPGHLTDTGGSVQVPPSQRRRTP